MPEDDASSPAEICGFGATARRASEPDADRYVRVLLPLPLPAALDYLAPVGAASLEPGCFVRVPLGTRNVVGVVWDGAGGELPAERLKPVIEPLPVPPLRPELRRFLERVAAYTMTPPGMVLRMAMSAPAALEPLRPRRLCAITPAGLAALQDDPPGMRLTPA